MLDLSDVKELVCKIKTEMVDEVSFQECVNPKFSDKQNVILN